MCSRRRDVDHTTGARIDEVRYVTSRVIPSRSGLLQTQKRFCAAIELQIRLIGKINLVTQENVDTTRCQFHLINLAFKPGPPPVRTQARRCKARHPRTGQGTSSGCSSSHRHLDSSSFQILKGWPLSAHTDLIVHRIHTVRDLHSVRTERLGNRSDAVPRNARIVQCLVAASEPMQNDLVQRSHIRVLAPRPPVPMIDRPFSPVLIS